MALFINSSDSVCISVIPDSHIGPMILHRLHEVGQVLKHRGVRMMIRKASVQIAIEPRYLTSQQLKRLFGDKGSRAVPAIDHDMQSGRLDMREVLLNVSQIVRNDRMLRVMPAPRYECTFLHHSSKFLNFLSMDGRLADTDLEPVIFGRVVTPGNHDAAADLQRKQGKVDERGRTNSEVDDIQPTRE